MFVFGTNSSMYPRAPARSRTVHALSVSLVLLVEDDGLILLALKDALQGAGYEVIACSSGELAIRELDQDAQRFMGLISDIRIGNGPDGWEVARHARELVAGLPVVYMTGDSAAEWTVQGVPESVLIPKPFAEAQIVLAISQLINAVPSARSSSLSPAKQFLSSISSNGKPA